MNRQTDGMPEGEKKHIDPATTVIPMAFILVLCAYFSLDPAGSTAALSAIRFFLGDSFGTFYLAVGLGFLIISFYLSFSDEMN